METRIGVIIVLYRSKEQNFQTLVGCSDIDVILVDNTPGRNLSISGGNVYYVSLKENKGVATAQNIGIEKARELGCTYLVFFDQDSMITSDYIDRMQAEYKRLKNFYSTLAVLGPTVVNQDTGQKYKTVDEEVVHGCKIVPALISSGSFYEMSVLNRIGKMEDQLFIDGVDFEWCWRARSKGYICAITQRVELYHKVGQSDCTFMGYPVIISAPVRYYYQYRNFLWLVRRSYVPLKWKIRTSIRKIVEIGILSFYPKSKNRWDIVKNIFRGIRDGILCNNWVK